MPKVLGQHVKIVGALSDRPYVRHFYVSQFVTVTLTLISSPSLLNLRRPTRGQLQFIFPREANGLVGQLVSGAGFEPSLSQRPSVDPVRNSIA